MAATMLIPPEGVEDTDGAKRVIEQFTHEYQPIFARVDVYLGNVIQEIPIYADAYKPWQKALTDLSRGLFLLNKNIPLTNTKAFLEAVKMFCFESAINFLQDICISCHIELERYWGERFRQNIDTLLFSYSILQRQQQPVISR